MPNLIEWVDSISSTGKDIMPDPNVSSKDYPEFAINRGMSQSIDTVMFAQAMNQRPGVKGRMHYAFLLAAVKKKKRYSKWAKKTEDDNLADLEMVKEYFNFSNEKALSALSILTKDQLKEIRLKQSTGGIKNDRKKSN